MTLIPARVASRLRSGGRANLDWDKNDFMTVHVNGITQTRFAGEVSVIKQDTRSSSASVRGAIAGTPLPPAASGEMGNTRSLVLDTRP